ncbi:type II toxin-antitoxin system RelE family toxin [Catellatospora vulcania]|uniref:type II toxin-antitoxin system RelE family toxin n=1 Tax=Catellatospora vulcania TaxID=1460450 RepID=UPI0012D3A553|nr:type II toxin-antitoxin system RelE/ParE family toxin [Catellatospora vulcania]
MARLTKLAEKSINELPDALQIKARNIVSRLDVEPALGKKLLGKLAGLRSVRLGRTHRIIYKTEPEIIVLSVTPRSDAYR